MTYSRPRQEYIDRYDKATVDDCRWKENFHKNYKSSEKRTTEEINMDRVASEMALHYDLLFTTLHWWEDKSKTIQKWMDDDARRDKMLEDAQAPEGVRCLKCWLPLIPGDKSIYDLCDKGERVLFFYDCPSGCLPHRAFFNDGEEYKVRREQCPKCKTDLARTHERIENEKVITTDTCPQCGYTNSDEWDMSTPEEKPDPDFEKDRARFCLTEETSKKARDERFQLEEMKSCVEGWKEKEEHKEDYDAVAQIKKLNVLDIEKLLAPAFEKAGYVRLQLGTPEITKDFFLPFTVYDNKSERTDRVSTHDLAKLIKKCLKDTNWRLMSDGINYRLGFLSGRLRAYEREEDLLGLVRQKDS
ncbi:MAG: hypothetical protein WAV50_00180 [Minisyncoccia bacterium]